MKLDETAPGNEGVLRDLKARHGSREPILPPDAVQSPYMQLGSHPDTVSRVWDELGSALPMDCKAIVYGTPALVHPNTGIILALAYGTRYVLKIRDEHIEDALKRGCDKEQTWAGGSKTNVEDLFGKGWLFGGWYNDETQWLLETFNDSNDIA